MFDIFIRFLIFLSIAGVVIFPTEVIAQGKEAIELAFFRVIPSLFPFFVLQTLVITMGISNFLSNTIGIVFKKLFGIENSSPYILGIIGGYPMGFKSVVELYNQKQISKSEAERMVGYCNNAGPAFIIGFVGVFLFNSKNLGYVLLLGHILASVLCGIISRKSGVYENTVLTRQNIKKPFYEQFICAVNSGFSSVLMVCGYIIFFSVFVEILENFNIFHSISFVLSDILALFNVSASEFKAILAGMIEMTTGINYLQAINSSIEFKIVVASFLLAFSGLSIHFQTLSFNQGLKLRKYYICKLFQSILAPIISLYLYKIIYAHTKTAFLPEVYEKSSPFMVNGFFIAVAVSLILFKKLLK